MGTKDVADLFLAALGKIEFYWNFYVIMVLALTGWLVSAKRSFSIPVKGLLTVGYGLFAIMNVIGLWGSYTFAEALRLDLIAAAANQANVLENTIEVVAHKSFTDQRSLAVVIHLVFGTAVLCIIWFRRPRATHANERQKPGACLSTSSLPRDKA